MYIPAFFSPASCIFGDLSQIYKTDPSVLSPNGGGENSMSLAWEGVQFQSQGGSIVLGQMGWQKLYNGTVENFAAINTGGLNWKEGDFTAPANGSAHEYETLYTYSNNTFHFYYDGTNYYNWAYTPAQLGCNWTTYGDSESEITSAHNQMPGTAVNPQTYYVNWIESNGGTWYMPTSGWQGVNSNNAWFYNALGVSGGQEYDTSYDKCN